LKVECCRSALAGDVAVFAAEIEQRLSFVNFGVVHFPQENRVIARKMRGYDSAAQLKQRIFKDRQAARRSGEVDGEALFGFGAVHASRKIFGDGLLPGFEHADAEAFFLLEEGKDFGAVVNANENQQRVERNGGEGVGGHALNFSGLALDSDDSNTGGELAKRFAKFRGRERRRCHLGSF